MSVSSVQMGQTVYGPYFANQSSTQPAESLVGVTAKTDTVTISDEAKALSVGKQAGAGFPLEAYSLPEWFGDLMPSILYADQELGMKYTDSNHAKYEKLSPSEKKNLSEYTDTLFQYFREGLSDKGIDSTADYYESIVQNKKGSEELHKTVQQKLADDLRAMELMQYFGITL